MEWKITTLEIVDRILPLTRDDNNCGFRKAKKLRARAELVILINDYKEGKAVVLPDEVLSLINECKQTMASI